MRDWEGEISLWVGIFGAGMAQGVRGRGSGFILQELGRRVDSDFERRAGVVHVAVGVVPFLLLGVRIGFQEFVLLLCVVIVLENLVSVER